MKDVLSMMEEEAVSTVNSPNDDSLRTVSSLASAIVTQEEIVSQLEATLKQAKQQLLKLTDDELPAAMNEMNLSKFALKNGSEVTIKSTYGASIRLDDRDAAFAWLREKGYGDLIKNTVTVSFGKGEDQKAQELISDLASRHLTPEEKTEVHPQTLRAWAKERIEKGDEIDMQLFGVYTGQRATIKGK
jgi:hypothetical protein